MMILRRLFFLCGTIPSFCYHYYTLHPLRGKGSFETSVISLVTTHEGIFELAWTGCLQVPWSVECGMRRLQNDDT